MDNVSVAAVVPGKDEIIAVTGETACCNTMTAWSSTDGGSTWTELGQGSGSAPLGLEPYGIAFDPKDSSTFWIYGHFSQSIGSQTAGLFVTTDGGNTFTAVEIPFLANAGPPPDQVSDVGIDSGSSTVLATGHGLNQAVYLTTDGGNTWISVGGSLPAAAAESQYVYVASASNFLVGASFALDAPDADNGTPGIYLTTDAGVSWSSVSSQVVFGSPTLANGTLYWSYLPNYTPTAKALNGGILTSSDGGETWSSLTELPLVYTVAPVVFPNGQVGSVDTGNNVRLFTPGTTTTPPTLGPTAPISVFGLVYDQTRNALLAWAQNGPLYLLQLTGGT